MVHPSSLVWVQTTQDLHSRVAIVECNNAIDDTYNITVEGTDSTGENVRPNYAIVDNLDNGTSCTFRYGILTFTVSPFTRTTFPIPSKILECELDVFEGIVRITFSERNLGVPDEQNQQASSGMSSYLRLDGTSPMAADLPFNGHKGINLANPTVGSDAANKTYVDSVAGSINVKNFGAIGDGIANDTGAFQNAINSIVNIGGTIFIPPGSYRVTNLAYYNNDPLAKTGITFQGAGQKNTIILMVPLAGPLFDIRGIPAAGTPVGTYFWWGGGFFDLTIDGQFCASATSDAMSMIGWINPVLRNVGFRHIPRNCLIVRTDLVYDPNPDWSSSSGGLIDHCYFERSGGIGTTLPLVGGPSWTITQSIYLFMGLGAISSQSASTKIEQCSFALTGWSTDLVFVNANAVSVAIGSGTGVTVNDYFIEGNEFDSASLAHITIDGAATTFITNNRFIFRKNQGQVPLTPLYGCRFASFGVNPVLQVLITNTYCRFDNAGTGVPIIFDFQNTGVVSKINIDGIAFSNGGGATYITFQGFTASNRHIFNDYRLKDDVQITSGKPDPSCLNSIAGTPAMNAGALAVLVFDTPDAIMNTLFGTAYYDTATGFFTTPQTGFYDVRGHITFTSSTDTDFCHFAIENVMAGVLYDFYSRGGNASVPTVTLPFFRRIFATKGDIIRMKVQCIPSRNLVGVACELMITLV